MAMTHTSDSTTCVIGVLRLNSSAQLMMVAQHSIRILAWEVSFTVGLVPVGESILPISCRTYLGRWSSRASSFFQRRIFQLDLLGGMALFPFISALLCVAYWLGCASPQSEPRRESLISRLETWIARISRSIFVFRWSEHWARSWEASNPRGKDRSQSRSISHVWIKGISLLFLYLIAFWLINPACCE